MKYPFSSLEWGWRCLIPQKVRGLRHYGDSLDHHHCPVLPKSVIVEVEDTDSVLVTLSFRLVQQGEGWVPEALGENGKS